MTMKIPYTVSKRLLAPLVAAIALCSCIKDNRNDCGDDLLVRIRIEAMQGTRGASFDDIDNVLIYIFDEHNYFVTTWQGGAFTEGVPYEAVVEIEPGTYRFVVWTNQGDVYTPAYTGAGEAADGLVLGLSHAAGGTITEDIPGLHHGMLEHAVVVPGTENEFTIDIRPDTYRINFEVKGLSDTGAGYRFSVRDNNSHYAFDNSIIEGMDEFEYVRTARFADGKLAASLNTLRLTDDRLPLFDLSDIATGGILYSNDMVGMIKKAYEGGGQTVDFDREYEFDITLTFEADMSVSVTVNTWSYNENPTEL